MAEKDVIFSSSIKYGGVFNFRDFYNFCYEWLSEEFQLDVSEEKYEEKITGDSKQILVIWKASRAITDYFKFEMGVTFTIGGLTNVEVNQGGVKVKTNQGGIGLKVKGTLIRDYDGKFETSPFNKFLRGIYEKWVIASRVGQMEDKVAGDCNEFLAQAKAYLDLEGKK